MREQGWFDDGDRGVHNPEHAQVRTAIAVGVRRWAIVLGMTLVPCAAWVVSGEAPPPGIVDAIGLAGLIVLVLAVIGAAGMVISARNTVLQGPLLLSAAWLLMGLVALGGQRRAQLLLRRHKVRPTAPTAAIVAAVAAAGAVVAMVLVVLQRGGAAPLDLTCWLAAAALGAGGAGGSADHPGKIVARICAILGALLLFTVALLVAMAYSR
jgi:hypothetical protein